LFNRSQIKVSERCAEGEWNWWFVFVLLRFGGVVAAVLIIGIVLTVLLHYSQVRLRSEIEVKAYERVKGAVKRLSGRHPLVSREYDLDY